jgi:cephalosporin-C deacetylase-like acetyl esterase
MKSLIVVITLLVLAVPSPSPEAARWWSHVEFLASDALEGRDTGSPGFEKAAEYVEAQFKGIGLRPGGVNGYRQPVRLESRTLVPEETTLTLRRDGTDTPLAAREDATLSARGELDGTVEAALVFVGYGLAVPEAKWDDFAGLDLHGKIAVYANVAPPAEMSDNVKSHVTSSGERWAVLRRAGAIGIATLPTTRPGAAGAGAAGGNPTGGSPATNPAGGNPAPAAGNAGRGGAGGFTPPPTIVLADRDLQDQAGQAVSLTLTRSGAAKVLAGSGHTLEEIDQLIAAKKPLPRFALPGTLRVHAAVKRTPVDSENVIGIYEGSDPRLKSEYVVMSAHLDHVGVGRAVNGDSIYNGAMDDASGVASVIEIARQLQQSGAKPKRSIVFMAQTAEEKGELGSKYFAAHPTVPFEQIVADINLDMFLPLYPLKVIEVQGLAESTLGDTVRAAAKDEGVDVQTDREPEQNRFIRSDQYSFIKRGIPSLAFKFGYEFGSKEEQIRRAWVRDVYHKPNDDLSQPVDTEAAVTFDRVITGLLQRVSDDPARPHWNDASFFKRFATTTAPPARAPIQQQLAFAPYHANGIYDVGETVGWTVTPGVTAPAYAFKWTIRRNNAVVLKEGALDLSTGKDTIEIAADQPGMIYVAVQAVAELTPSAGTSSTTEAPHFTGGNAGRDTGFYAVGAAVAPSRLELSTPRPEDFDSFWDGKLAAQAKIAVNPVLTPVHTDVPGVEMSMFQLDALGSKAHGYVARPAGDGRFPAVIQLQYAGVYALNAAAVARRASEGWLIIDVDSHDKLPSDPSGDVPRAYQAIGNTDRETSYFLNMYLRDSRVLDYLLTRADWDGRTIVLMGGSMGGQQSLALAGLRPEKITAALVCVPAGADSNADLHGRKAGYPNWPSDNPDVMKTARYFDTVNFASRIKAPVMTGFGFIDTISPPAGVWTMLNQIHSAVEALPMIDSEHDNLTPDKGRACPARQKEILDAVVHGGTFTSR